MKFRYKLMIFIIGFVMISTVSSVILIANHMINNRLEQAIENAFNETWQLVSMLSHSEYQALNPASLVSIQNRRGEQYKIMNDYSSESYYILHQRDGFNYIEVYVPLKLHMKMLRGQFDVTDIVEESRFLKIFIGVSMGIIFVLIILLSFVFSIPITRNIRKLETASQRYSQGEYDHHIEIKTKDEFGTLGKSFNEMAVKTRKYIEDLNHVAVKNKKLYGALTHEISTPLTSIIGYSELMMSHKYDEDLYNKSLNHIYNEGRRLRSLSSNLLSLSNEQLNRECQQLSSLIEACFHMSQQKYVKDIVFKLSGEMTVFVDVNLMKVVFSNLFNNSFEVLEEGGSITCDIRDEEVWIRDDGPGVTEERLFDPFVTSSDESHHLGLGLTLVKDVVESHGDWIHCEPVEEGACFVIRFVTSKWRSK